MSGVWQVDNTPTPYRPARFYGWASLLLCLSLGTTLAAVFESWLAAQWAWLTLFSLAATANAILYGYTLSWLLEWVHLTDDDNSVCGNVCCSGEHRNHHDVDPRERDQP